MRRAIVGINFLFTFIMSLMMGIEIKIFLVFLNLVCHCLIAEMYLIGYWFDLNLQFNIFNFMFTFLIILVYGINVVLFMLDFEILLVVLFKLSILFQIN